MASKKLTEIINEKNEILSKDAASKNKKSPFKNNVVPAIESLLEVKQKVYDIRTQMKERIGHLNTLYDQYYRKVSEIKEENNRKIAELEKTYPDLKGSKIYPWPPRGFKGPGEVWMQYCKLKIPNDKELNLDDKPILTEIRTLAPFYEAEINKSVIPALERVKETMNHYIKTSKCKSSSTEATKELHAQKKDFASRVSFYAEQLIKKYKNSTEEIKKLALKERKEAEAVWNYRAVKSVNHTRKFVDMTLNGLIIE